MENYKLRKLIEMISSIIDISFVEDKRKMALKKSISHYKKIMTIMKKEGGYTEEEIAEFEIESMRFYQSWMKLYGRHGVTNYMHMIRVIFFGGYMRKYRNLNKYSRQGLEALNTLIKLFFFRRTKKGGKNSGGGRTNLKSKLVPIGRLVQ